MDPLQAVFVFCFVFGVATSVLSLALGALHGAGGNGDTGHDLGGHAGDGHGALGDGHGGDVGDGDGDGDGVSPLNLQTITTFLAFFGGSGWVLYGSAGLGPALALVLATLIGIGGGSIVFLFLVKVLIAGQRFMDPAASRMEGTVGKVTLAIRPEGTGEIQFLRDGAHRSEGARSSTGLPIPVGTEVVIVRYDKGLAYVEPWASFAGEE